ncbi:GtrA family protein [Uliginosibacterium sp. H1]|uniref:GtrA family protein n=1 Tax=Uliginosibacterium sp. H1 TaxID=3114757 RepID=UPI002E187526|nr:GtrA family protein [Uliginosibacterium sp. H1]
MALARQIKHFLVVGAGATALQYILLGLFVEAFGMNAVLASALGYALSSLANYAANRRLTFQSDARHRDALPRFAVVALSGLLLNTVVMWVAHNLLDWHYLVAQVLATAVALVWNFILNRCWTFAPARP